MKIILVLINTNLDIPSKQFLAYFITFTAILLITNIQIFTVTYGALCNKLTKIVQQTDLLNVILYTQ